LAQVDLWGGGPKVDAAGFEPGLGDHDEAPQIVFVHRTNSVDHITIQ
jgi:hypothetical protein